MSTFASASVTRGIPAIILGGLHRAAATTSSPEEAVRILRTAGVESAAALLDSFTAWSAEARMDSTAVADLAEGEFWSLLSEFFVTQGWGSVEHEHVHPGVLAVSSGDWSESMASAGQSCHFTTGMLAEVLRLIAARDVAVLEVECRSTGSLSCRFLIGSPHALETVYSELQGGSAVPEALGALR